MKELLFDLVHCGKAEFFLKHPVFSLFPLVVCFSIYCGIWLYLKFEDWKNHRK